jgi:PhnB protein
VWGRALAEGAKAVLPLADQPYGYRQGRQEDPFGHFWIVSANIGGAPS